MADLTLFGLLNTGMLGVYTHKLAMNVVAHNVANVDTPGFSRQRPVIQATPPVPMNTLTQPSIPLQFGTGSMVKTIERVRDEFLDVQYRQVNNRYRYWESVMDSLHFIEQLLGEPGESGIRKFFDDIFSGLEDVMSDPTNAAAKRGFVSKVEEFLAVFKDLYNRLRQLREDVDEEIAARAGEINATIHRIADLNAKIRTSSILGVSANDLLDERDLLLDQLSDLVNISYRIQPDGQILLNIGDKAVLNGSSYMEVKVYRERGADGVNTLMVGNSELYISDGKLKALLYMRDEKIPELMKRFDELSVYLADTFNMVHRESFDSSGNTTGIDLFKGINVGTEIDSWRLFRVAGVNRLSGGPVRYVNGLLGLASDPSSYLISLKSTRGSLVFLDEGFTKTEDSSITVETGQNLQDVMSSINDSTKGWYSWLRAGYEDYEPTKYRFYLYSPSSFDGRLVVDTSSGELLSALGLPSKPQDVLTITSTDFESALENLSSARDFYISVHNLDADTESAATISLSGTFDDFVSQLSSLPYFKAIGVDSNGDGSYDLVHLIPFYTDSNGDISTKINGLELHDPDGLFALVNAQNRTLQILDTSSADTLENVFDLYSASYLEVDFGSTPSAFLSTGTLEFTVEDKLDDGGVANVSIDLSTVDDLNDLVTQINNQLTAAGLDTSLVAWTDGSRYIRIIPLEPIDYSWESVAFDVTSDPTGIFNTAKEIRISPSGEASELYSSMGLTYNGSTRERIRKQGFEVRINSTPVHVDPVLDDLNSMAEKINASGTGILADVSPHGKFYLRAGRRSDLDLTNFHFEAPSEVLQRLGLIEDDGNRVWKSTLEKLLDPTWERSQFLAKLKYADLLTISNELGITLNLDVSDAISTVAASLGVDLGIARDTNGDWIVDSVAPRGESNTDAVAEYLNLKSKRYLGDGDESMSEFFGAVVAELGIEGQTAQSMKLNAEAMKKQVDTERERVKGVSLDEEMGNMIKYQHAFNAAARVISAVDEMIGRIIDRLGVVGR